MKLQSNSLLKLLVPTVLVGTVFIGIKACKDPLLAPRQNNQNSAIADLSDSELKALGIDGDTAADTVATLVGQMKQYRRELQDVKEDNAELLKENKRLSDQDQTLDTRIDTALNRERETLRDEVRQQQDSLLDIFQTKLEQLTDTASQIGHHSSSANDDLPLGLGIEPGDLPKSIGNGLRWLEPDDARNIDMRSGNNEGSKFSFPTSFTSLDDSVINHRQKQFRAATKGERDLEESPPAYTLAENSTLIGSVAMTALLGRVPINGTVTDPYPFKVMIGKDNLIANGLELPDVEGAIMSGSASGDWTLSCVRGNIHSMTFVFRDGTIRTVPEASGKSNGSGDSKQSSILGWLSDPHGLPCIPGEKKSNAAQYLGSQFLLSGSAAAAEAFANGQTTNIAEGGNITSAITGSSGKFVMGQALGGR